MLKGWEVLSKLLGFVSLRSARRPGGGGVSKAQIGAAYGGEGVRKAQIAQILKRQTFQVCSAGEKFEDEKQLLEE